MNEARTVGYMLQANGDLVVITRDQSSDMWSPPTLAASLQGGSDLFHDYLALLTGEEA
jgi:hypothetical protein